MADGWADLSDAELRRRLIQRGVPTEDAIALTARRDDDRAVSVIEKVLG